MTYLKTVSRAGAILLSLSTMPVSAQTEKDTAQESADTSSNGISIDKILGDDGRITDDGRAMLRRVLEKNGMLDREARTPLRISGDADASALELGSVNLSDSDALFRQPATPLAAVRVTIDQEERVLPLTLIGKLDQDEPGTAVIPTAPEQRAWCDTQDRERGRIACYQDLDSDGVFETLKHGIAAHDHNPLSIVQVVDAKRDEPEGAVPLAYAGVADADLPLYFVRYDLCTAKAAIPNYQLRIEVKDDSDVRGGDCRDAARLVSAGAVDGTGRFRVDRVEVDILPGAENRTARVVSGLPVGLIVDRIGGSSAKLYDLGDRPHRVVESLVRQIALRRRPAYSAATAPEFLANYAKKGTVVLSAPLEYGFTGVVQTDTTSYGMFDKREGTLTKGQRVYGLPMQTTTRYGYGGAVPSGSSQMYWCAPFEKKPGEWRAHCFTKGGVTYSLYRDERPAFLITGFPASPKRSDAIVVEEGPVDFSDISVKLRFLKWNRESLMVELEASPDGVDDDDRNYRFKRDADGTVTVAFAGGLYRFSGSQGGDASIEQLRPGKAGTSVFPKKASASDVEMDEPAAD